MKVEITVKVDGKKVAKHVEQVDGTLEQMEEKNPRAQQDPGRANPAGQR